MGLGPGLGGHSVHRRDLCRASVGPASSQTATLIMSALSVTQEEVHAVMFTTVR